MLSLFIFIMKLFFLFYLFCLCFFLLGLISDFFSQYNGLSVDLPCPLNHCKTIFSQFNINLDRKRSFINQSSFIWTNQIDWIVLEQLAHNLILNMSYIKNWVGSFFINLIFFLILSLNLIIFFTRKNISNAYIYFLCLIFYGFL